MGYADLHIHIKNNSDNKKGQTIEEILKEAINNNTYTLAFTSHNTLLQYTELFQTIKRLEKTSPQLYNNIMSKMKFVIGFEINSRINENTARDMLAYNIPIEKIQEMQNWLDENTNKDSKTEYQLEQLKYLENVADKLKIPYQKGNTVNEEQIYAGMVFATSVKEQIDELLVDILLKDNPIGNIFNRLIEQDKTIQEEISNEANKNKIYIKILNNDDILKKIPQIEQIKQLYYQIIDLRLFASQDINEGSEKRVDDELKEIEEIMKQEFETKNLQRLDEESINLINAELYSKFFEKDNTFFDNNKWLSSLNNDKLKEGQELKKIKLFLYYSMAKEINDFIKNDKQIKDELIKLQNALIKSKISFADILNRLNWFNSELIKIQNTPFSFNMDIYKPKIEDIIQQVHKVGGILEVAHPYQYVSTDDIDKYLEICVEKGVDGIEALYAVSGTKEKYQEMKNYIQKFCEEKNLICEHGGSDYHQNNSEKVGILRCGIQIDENEITNKINKIPAHEFMKKMEKNIENEQEIEY